MINNCGDLRVEEVVKSHGYPCEVYENIRTEDGYLLTAYRIPHGRNNLSSLPKPVVLLMHGLMTNCFDFVITGPKRALGLQLSDQGYDVWLPNTRGKNVSRKHVTLDSNKDEQYWKFSFHEMGIYDIPAIFQHIEKVTGLRTITYIGHSQGSVLPFVLISEKPEYNNRFNLVITLSPVAIVPNLISIPYKILNVTRYVWLGIMSKTGYLQFPPNAVNNFIVSLSKRFGNKDGWFLSIAEKFIFSLHGTTPHQFVKDDIPLMLTYFPDTTSAIVIKHFGQTYRSGIFKKMNYGPQKNMEKYGTANPPLYDLQKVMCPVAMFCSSGDTVARPEDVTSLYNQLPNCIALHQMDNPTFNHADFLFGKYAVDLVYPLIFDHLKKYSKVK